MGKLTASVLGASGYSGGELIRLLSRHPSITLDRLYAQSSAGALVSDIHPWYSGAARTFEPYAGSASLDSDIVFLALPHGEAMELAPELLASGSPDSGRIVIDLSGDHRLKNTDLFARYYGRPQTSGAMLASAVYGLPEWSSCAIRTARLIANPGCYATSAILALAPLVKESLIRTEGIVINSMSGVTGAGRKSSVEYSFTELHDSVKAYRVGDHQHTPEIQTVLEGISCHPVRVTFIPHLIPVARGIYTTMVAEMQGSQGSVSKSEVVRAFESHYSGSPFVRFDADRIPELRRVLHSNYIDIGIRVLPETNQIVVVSAIDNLVKGAAGQAVQNMNIACGFPETEGLL